MRITLSTSPQEVAEKTKSAINLDTIPNMRLKNEGKPNGFASDEKDFRFWLHRICGRQK